MSLHTFTAAYLEAALWSSSDDEGESLDRTFGGEDIAPEALADLEALCAAFYAAHEPLWRDQYGHAYRKDDEMAGHDFWLTAAGHGAGFWDGDLPEAIGATLADACKGMGRDLYVGDDASIYSVPA